MTTKLAYYIVDGWRGDGDNLHIAGQWVILASCADEACTIAERRQAGIADFENFTATEDTDHLFDAEENLTEEQP